MNLDSARSRIKILEGLAKRIERTCCDDTSGDFDPIINDAESILKQCRFLAMDLQDEDAAMDRSAHLGATEKI